MDLVPIEFSSVLALKPPRVSDLKLREGLERKKKMDASCAVGGPITAALERNKKRKVSGSGGTRKRPRHSEAWISQLPLRSKGDSEDEVGEGENPIPASPIAAKAPSPLPSPFGSNVPASSRSPAPKAIHVECSA